MLRKLLALALKCVYFLRFSQCLKSVGELNIQVSYQHLGHCSFLGVLHAIAFAKNTLWARHVCTSVRIIQLDNRWADLDEIWYGRYTIQVSCAKL
jgi:hypothetical protein